MVNFYNLPSRRTHARKGETTWQLGQMSKFSRTHARKGETLRSRLFVQKVTPPAWADCLPWPGGQKTRLDKGEELWYTILNDTE